MNKIKEFKKEFDEGNVQSTHQPVYCSKSYCLFCGKSGNLVCFSNPENFKCYLICENCRDKLYQKCL